VTLVQHLFESAGPAGTTLTNANSGSSTGNVAGGTQVSSSATAAHGALGGSFTNVAAAGTYRRWNFAANATATVYSFSGVLTLPASAWTQTVSVAGFPVAAGANGNRAIQVNASGQVNFGGSNNVIGAALTWGQKYRFTVTVNGATSQQVKVYQQSSPGVWDQQVGTTGTTAHADFGSAVVGVDAGVNQAPAGSIVVTVGWDDIQLNDGTTTEIPDYTTANTPPVVTAGSALTVAPSATATLTFSATDDGTIASRATSFDFPTSGAPSITGGTTGTPSFTAGATLGSLYVARHTATDNLGASSSATQEVRVNLAGSTTARPLPMDGTGAGTWTKQGGSTTDGAALADESDTTYLESPTISSSEVRRRIRLQPSSTRASAQIVNRLGTDTGTANATVRLYEGATLRQSWTHALTTTMTDFTDALSSATVASITDWGNLFVEVGVTA